MNDNEIKIPVCNMTETVSQSEQTSEFEFPDHIPDVRKIAWYTCEPGISGSYMNSADSEFEYEGENVWTMLLVCEDNSLHSAVFSGSIGGKIRMPETVKGDPSFTVCAESPVLRLTSPRKVSAKCRVRVALTNINDECCTGDIAEDESIEKLTAEAECLYTVGGESGVYRISEDVVLDGNTPEIGEIILCRVDALLSDCRAAENSVMLRGKALMSMLYKTPTGENAFLQRDFPLSETLDIDGMKEDMCLTATTRVQDVRAQAAMNSFGENRILQLDLGWSAKVTGESNKTVTVIKDAYSLEYESECIFAPCTMTVLDDCLKDMVKTSQTFTFENIGLGEGDTVLGALGQAETCTASFSEDKKTVTVKGKITLKIAAESNSEKGTVPVVGNCELPFEKTIEREYAEGEKFECTALLGHVGVRTEGNELKAEAEVFICFKARSNKVMTVAVDIDIDKDRPCGGKRNEIILCYPSGGESLWDIAKRYHTRESDLAADTAPGAPYMITRDEPRPITIKIDE